MTCASVFPCNKPSYSDDIVYFYFYYYYLPQNRLHVYTYIYTPYEGLNLDTQKNRKLEEFYRKLEEIHSIISCYFHRY